MQLNGQKGIVAEYLTYKAHVCRQIYANPDLADTRTAELESEWPEYPKSTTLLPVRAYLTSGAQQHVPVLDRPSDLNEGRVWLREYLEEDVQQKQEHRQHHIHIPNDDGTRIPLAHCRHIDNPKLCKSEFPRTKWLTEKPVVLCKCILNKMGLPASGRRNKLGSLHGPMNNEWLNGTHPAMLAAQGCNSDVQLPYRLPISAGTHSCDGSCLGDINEEEMVLAAQLAQDAQAGYACDYCNKRQPMAFSEVKECMKGVRALGSQLKSESLA